MPLKSKPRSIDSSREKTRASGRPAKGKLKKSAILKCFVTPEHKEAVEAYCLDRDLPVASLLYQLVIQIVPDPNA